MEIQYKKLTEKELDTLIQMRINQLKEEVRKYGCGTVQITASDMGVLLYTDFGSVKNGNFMQYKI